MKTIALLKDKYSSKGNSSSARLDKNRVRIAIEFLCEKYLVEFGDVLTFESLPKALNSTVSVIEERVLTSKYEFEQLSETLFRVRLKEISII